MRAKAPRSLPRPFVDDAARSLLSLEAASPQDVQRVKRRLSAAHGLGDVPTNADILSAIDDAATRERLLPVLRMKPTRTLSGVAIVTVQTDPAYCPHGTCTFCPGGPDNAAEVDGERVGPSAQSYTGREPAALRALRHRFDPYAQTASRLADLHATGHAVDKVDFIVQGGTFPARDADYQRRFLAGCYAALNDWGVSGDRQAGAIPTAQAPANAAAPAGAPHPPPPAAVGFAGRRRTPHPSTRSTSPADGEGGTTAAQWLAAAQAANERAAARMIGLTVETKPDWCLEEHVDLMLELGVTRVEIGVQSVHDDQLKATNRGHTVADAVRATRVAKDAGLKVCVHVMPGLPGWSRERDLETFRALTQHAAWAPDMLKVYPLLVMPGTPLHKQWERGQYEPVDEAYCVDLLAEAKTLVPKWMRIQRIDRDIPTTLVDAGVKKSNLRELVNDEMARRGTRCRCIRCRESGRVHGDVAPRDALTFTHTTYDASGGVEHFLAYEDRERDAVVAFVRLREPSADAARPEVHDAVIVRELRALGREVAISDDPEAGDVQHRGLGRALMQQAGELAREKGRRRVVVTSGVGVRPYYAKLGYALEGPYMVKDL